MSILSMIKQQCTEEREKQISQHFNGGNIEEYIAELKKQTGIYSSPSSFCDGDLIQQKVGLNEIYKFPVKGYPVVVLGLHQVNKNDPYNSLRIGVIDEDGDFITFLVDPQRFELYEAE